MHFILAGGVSPAEGYNCLPAGFQGNDVFCKCTQDTSASPFEGLRDCGPGGEALLFSVLSSLCSHDLEG